MDRRNVETPGKTGLFYNRKFPHQYTNVFRNIQNDIATLSDKLSKQDKIRLLTFIGYEVKR